MRFHPLMAGAVLGSIAPLAPIDWRSIREPDRRRRGFVDTVPIVCAEDVRQLRAGPGDMAKPKGKRARRRRKG